MATTNYFNANGRIVGEQTVGSTRLDYVRDGLGSVIGMINQSRSVQAGYRYKPYGDILSTYGTQPAFMWNGTLGYLKAAGAVGGQYSVRARFCGSPWLANALVEAIKRHGFQNKEDIRAAIDACLKLTFDYTGDGIDLGSDLTLPSSEDPDFDKYPQWIEGASPAMKCEVGRIMAREDIPHDATWSIEQEPLGACLPTFKLPDGSERGPWTLEHCEILSKPLDGLQRINQIGRDKSERQIKPKSLPGMPNFPGQPGRFYMAGLARFLTSVREAEWLGGEQPYAYAMNNPATYADPTGHVPSGSIPPHDFPEACRACSVAINNQWVPLPQHKCNACYAHCTSCCLLTVLAGPRCALDTQHLQNTYSNPGPAYVAARNMYCGFGVTFAGGISDATNAQEKCSSACLSKCPYKKPNPRPTCNHLIQTVAGGRNRTSFPPSFPPLTECDPVLWKQCRGH